MRMLKFAVEGQQLAKRGDFAGVTAGSKGYLRCHFEQSDPEWLMAKKIAVFNDEYAVTHLKLLALRQSREQYVSGLLNIPESELTLGGRKAIARWYEVYGYDDAMVQEAAVQAGAKRDLWYWNSILKTWNAKGLRTVHDVRSPVAIAGASRNLRVDREAPSGNDFLKNAARRRPLKKKPE